MADRSLTHAWRLVAGLAIAGFAALPFLLPASASAHPKPGTQVAHPVRSAAPDANLVKESFVRVYKPLPKRDGPHPKACDWISYLRYRSAHVADWKSRDGVAHAGRRTAAWGRGHGHSLAEAREGTQLSDHCRTAS